MPGVMSRIELLDYQVRSFNMVVSDDEEAPSETSLALDFDFLQHEVDPTLYLVSLSLGFNRDVPENYDVQLRASALVEGYIRVPENLAPQTLRLYLVEGTELLFNTFRGTLSTYLAPTMARDYILPCVDFAAITIKSDAEREQLRSELERQQALETQYAF